jgi:hypothetical protein
VNFLCQQFYFKSFRWKTSPIKIWSRSLLRTALKLGGKCSFKKNCLNKFSSKDVKIFRWRFFYRLNDFSKEKLACFDAHCLQIFKSMTIVQFCSFKWIFLRPALTVNLFKTPVVGQFTRKTTPADGRERYSSSPLIHSFYEEKIWAQLEGVNASAV